MQRLTVLYTPPSDPEAFEAHYLTEHVPLARAVPGLARLEAARVVATPDGSPAPYYRVADLFFEDADFAAAVASPEMVTAGRDAARLAARTGSTVTMLVAAVD